MSNVLRGREFQVITLAAVAGTFDAIAYLGLGNVFPANMTGNTILLGVYASQGEWISATRASLALLGFAIGVGIGVVIVDRHDDPWTWSPLTTFALAVEVIVLIAVAVGWMWLGDRPADTPLLILITLAALTMGVQSAATGHLSVSGVSSTAVTGTITQLVAGLVHGAQRARHRHRRTDTPLTPLAAVWLVYVVGAVLGGVAERLWAGGAVFLPIGLVAPVILVALVWQVGEVRSSKR